MNRYEFIIATAIILFVAFALGWFANWLIHRFLRVAQSEMGELDRMAQQLHEAEEQRDQTVAYFQQREADMSNQLSQTQVLNLRRSLTVLFSMVFKRVSTVVPSTFKYFT